MLFPCPGHTEKNVDDLWAANVRVISEVMKKAGVQPAEVAALAVTGHGNGMYLVDADGKPAHDGINSADSRAADYVARWYADGTFERVLPRTCQSIWAAQPAALLAWFRDHDPAVLERTRWIFMCKDYIRYRLTGEAVRRGDRLLGPEPHERAGPRATTPTSWMRSACAGSDGKLPPAAPVW